MSTPALPEESVPALSERERLLYTFTAPARTMADLRSNPSWWVPWLLISLVSIASITLDKKIGFTRLLETEMRSDSKAVAQVETMTPDQREKVLMIQKASTRLISYASPVITLLTLVVVAAVLLGMFNFGFGAKLRFQELMGVSAYSFLPSILNTLLMIVVLFSVVPERFDLKHPLATSVGYFVPANLPFLRSLLGAFDVFTLWEVFLLSVGISQLSKVKKGTAFVAIFVLFFLFKLAGAAIASI